MINFITRPFRGRPIRMFFTPRGKIRFILDDAVAALEPNHRTKSAIRDLRRDHLRPLSRTDTTETVDLKGLNALAMNTVWGRGLEFATTFQRSLPQAPQSVTEDAA